ncbi:hypothetical protein P872_18890 [Rhodonellum psychrophilum GCM71 = DSM 17998]|uniref:Rrf2 family transcriptional regulator n=2 Tax=Rhodonellum TaxID=336827 RepID=U5BZZ9_9BACT|nr:MULTISPECIES: Rrf2 family transcriptional regulator [Rhodonellum]ERM82251.1 hypothetical protein P872_18890 [Rhodonellum psychrophilum GCM71 = DSM 17998]SDZ25854.1 transcriptional regulator, BadM/Rrf2 family [Rhodonellum ikkaensis]
MFSKTCQYGIRAVIYVCSKSRNSERVGVKEICQAIDAPEFFTGKILQMLAKNKIISSAKGPNGGFYIDEDQKGIALIDIVKAIDGDNLFIGCGLGLNKCSEINPCPMHHEFKVIRDNLKTILSNKSISVLAEEVENGSVTLNRLIG